jgi:hypothetical protein
MPDSRSSCSFQLITCAHASCQSNSLDLKFVDVVRLGTMDVVGGQWYH